MLYTGYHHRGPAAVRYPRGKGPGAVINEQMTQLPIGKARLKRQGKAVALLAFGSMVEPAQKAAESLNATVIDMRFIKPLDEEMIEEMANQHQILVTVEENTVMGGAGSAVNEFLQRRDVLIPVLNIGLPDQYLPHGKPPQMLSDVGLDSEGIVTAVKDKLSRCNIQLKVS